MPLDTNQAKYARIQQKIATTLVDLLHIGMLHL